MKNPSETGIRQTERQTSFASANEDNYLLLPQSQEAEQAVLGAILAQSDCLNKIVFSGSIPIANKSIATFKVDCSNSFLF